MSQHARRIWAATAGRDDEWDWAAFGFSANVRLTASRLRRDELPFAEGGSHGDDTELAETLRAYDSAAAWYASRTDQFPTESSLMDEMDWLVDHSSGNILDAGTGGGRDAQYLASSGRTVIALDASVKLLAHLRARKNLLPIVGDVRRLPLLDESVGAIWCSAVLLHLRREDVIRSLREFYRILVTRGLVQVSVKEGSGHVTSGIAGRPDLRRHFFLYEDSDLRLFARLAGFSIRRIWAEDEMDASATVQRWIKVLLEKPGNAHSFAPAS